MYKILPKDVLPSNSQILPSCQLGFLASHQTLWLKSKKLGWGCPFRDWLLVDDWGMWSCCCCCWAPKWCKAWGWEENCGGSPLLKLFPLTAGICPVAILSLCTSSLNASFRAVGHREIDHEPSCRRIYFLIIILQRSRNATLPFSADDSHSQSNDFINSSQMMNRSKNRNNSIPCGSKYFYKSLNVPENMHTFSKRCLLLHGLQP